VQKYIVIKYLSDAGISLQTADMPIQENCEVLYSFEAANFNEAMAKRNELLGFGQYIPLSENIIVERLLRVFDKNGKPLHPVKTFIYQPVKVSETEFHCEYHIDIEHYSNAGKILNTKSLAGKTIIGYDSLQAIQLAMKMIKEIIIDYNNNNDNKIYWQEYGQDCGF
jgi:hypothetical protein